MDERTHVYAEPGVAERDGSRWQVVLRDHGDDPEVVYFHVNDRDGGVLTLDLNDDDCTLDLVIQVTKPELLRLAAMLLQAGQ